MVPSLVVRLLFGAEIVGVGVVVSRLVGIALIGLGVACWPGPPLIGMLTYSVLATLYLTYIGFAANLSGRYCGRQLSSWVLTAASRPGMVSITNAKLTKLTRQKT